MGQRRIVQWIVFFVLVLLSIGTVHAQTPTEITIFRDEDSFTLYVSGEGSVSLQGLTLAVDDPAVTRVLQDYYPVFREIASRFDRLSLPLCLNLLRSNSDTPLAIDCQNIPREQLYIQLLADADVFWFDTQANIPLTVQVGSGAEMQFCPPGPRCQIDFTPSSNISTSSKPASAANLDQREILMLLAQFEQISGNPIEPHREWELVLSDAIRELDDQINARVLFVPQIVRTQDEARVLSDLYDATLVIWGNVRGAALESNYTITPRWSRVSALPGQTEVNGTIDELRLFVSPGGDTQYVLNFVLGQLLYFDDQKAEALHYFENAIALAPTAVERQREMGLDAVYFYKGYVHQVIETDLNGAELAYSHLLEIDPNSILAEEAYNNRGVVRYDQGDLTGALADYDRAIALNPEYADAYYNRGIARYD
ncbi:MAG: tetratricopeptide repeat protein, partial [Anaerolineae bacterium]|nr:tetratricopeptide repeat protein [Anaerolineae bacterium]